MTPLEKFRQQVAIAKASTDLKNYVVQTADEAQALLDEIDGPDVLVITDDVAKVLVDTFKDGFRPGLLRLMVDPPADDDVV